MRAAGVVGAMVSFGERTTETPKTGEGETHLADNLKAVPFCPLERLAQPDSERLGPHLLQDPTRLMQDPDQELQHLERLLVLDADFDCAAEGRVVLLAMGPDPRKLGELGLVDGAHPLSGERGVTVVGGGEVGREDKREDGRVGAARGESVQCRPVAAQKVQQSDGAVRWCFGRVSSLSLATRFLLLGSLRYLM